jgi:hypothetical protein
MNLISAPPSLLSPVRTTAPHASLLHFPLSLPLTYPSSHQPRGSIPDCPHPHEPSSTIGMPPHRSLPATSPTPNLLSEPHRYPSYPAHPSRRPHAVAFDPAAMGTVSKPWPPTLASRTVTVPCRTHARAARVHHGPP